MITSFTDLNVYQQSISLAREIFQLTRKFPKEETYLLKDQMLRSSRSIPANIAEGWAKRRFVNVFRRHLVDAYGSCNEMKTWLQVSFDCKYIPHDEFVSLFSRYDDVGKMVYALIQNWKTFDDKSDL